MSSSLARGRSAGTVLAAWLLAMALTPSMWAHAQTDSRIQVLFARAERLFRAGEHEAAVPLVDRVIERIDERGDDIPEGLRLLLFRSLTYRAIGRWSTGARKGIDADLDRIVELDPRFEMSSDDVPRELVARFAGRRQRKIGYLQISVFPADSRVLVDGQPVDPLPDILPVLAGEHNIYADNPGFAGRTETVRVRSNRTEGVSIELERASATIRLATQPAGATLVIDDDLIGVTVAALGQAGGEEASESIVIEGLLPGWHEIEITLPDHRPFRQRIEIPDLMDYDLGTVRLDRSMGVVLLRGVPRAAEVLMDGESPPLQWQADLAASRGREGSARIELPVGSYRLVIRHGAAGIYESDLVVEDGATLRLDVALRPGLVFVGVVGGDDLDRDAVRTALLTRIERIDGWFVLDRSGDGSLEQIAGLRRSEMGTGDPEELREAVDWARLQQEVATQTSGSLFMLATVPEGTPPGVFDLWLWSAPPGSARPQRVRLAVDDQERLGMLTTQLREPLPRSRPWFGATLIDNGSSGRPTVVWVEPTGPAAMAGLKVGDEIRTVDGVEVTGVAELQQLLGATEPFAGRTLQYGRGASIAVARLTLGSSPQSIATLRSERLNAVIWAAAAAQIARADATTPAWVAELDQALILMQGAQWERAAEWLAAVRAPEDLPFGQSAVDYWRGVALSSGPEPDLEAARLALRLAAGRAGGRLHHHDGPLVAPRALARLAELELRHHDS